MTVHDIVIMDPMPTLSKVTLYTKGGSGTCIQVTPILRWRVAIRAGVRITGPVLFGEFWHIFFEISHIAPNLAEFRIK